MMKRLKMYLLSLIAVGALSAAADEISLDWNAIVGADSYNVYMAVFGTSNYTNVASLDETTWTTNVTEEGRWQFYVKSVNLAGESDNTSPVVSSPDAPSAPGTLTVTASGMDVNLTWTLISGATSYNVYTKVTGTGDPFVQVANVTTNAYSTNMVEHGQWDYLIKSVNLAGESVASPIRSTPAPVSAPGTLNISISPSP